MKSNEDFARGILDIAGVIFIVIPTYHWFGWWGISVLTGIVCTLAGILP